MAVFSRSTVSTYSAKLQHGSVTLGAAYNPGAKWLENCLLMFLMVFDESIDGKFAQIPRAA
jgi:hypothetical protein